MTGPTPDQLAELHALCFATPRPWTALEFARLLETPGTRLVGDRNGFALARIALDEAELLTIAVAPAHRHRGLGARLLLSLHAGAKSAGAQRMFLEVSAENHPARALYAKLDYRKVGCRPRYYLADDGTRYDALILARDLT